MAKKKIEAAVVHKFGQHQSKGWLWRVPAA
jgi:hypothetical protein